MTADAMTEAELIRVLARHGYNPWDDTDGSTERRLILIAQRLERDDPPKHSDA